MLVPARRAESTPATPPNAVGYDTFLGLIWTAVALSLIFVLFRLYSRFRGPRRLYWDDVFIIFALLLGLTSAGLWQWAAKFMYYILDVRAGLAMPGPQIYPYLRQFVNVQLIAELFYYTQLVLVKLSFLFFFRRLGENVQRQKYIWWPVLIFSLIVYVVSVGDAKYDCFVGSVEYLQRYCNSNEEAKFQSATLKANMVLDVVSDFLVMLIPVTLLWNVQMRLKRKLAFIGLFSLSIITIVIAIVRAVTIESTSDPDGHYNATFLWLWSNIQASLAIMIACLSAFPQLFTSSATKKKPIWTPTDTYYQRLRARMTKGNKKEDTLHDLSTISLPGRPEPESEPEATPNNVGTSSPGSAGDNTRGEGSCDSQRPVLKPVPTLHRQVIVSSGGVSDHGMVVPHGDQTTRQMDYYVTREQAPEM